MTLEELLDRRFKAGKAEGYAEGYAKEYAKGYAEGLAEGRTIAIIQKLIIECLSDIAPLSDGLEQRILSIEDLEKLLPLHKTAARATSHEEFEAELDKMNL